MRFHWFAKPCFTNGIPMILGIFSEKMRFSIFATPLMLFEDFCAEFSWNFVNLGGKVTVVPRFRFSVTLSDISDVYNVSSPKINPKSQLFAKVNLDHLFKAEKVTFREEFQLCHGK